MCFQVLCNLQAELHGVLPVSNSCFEPLQQTAVSWSNTMKQAAAVCNSLSMVNKLRVVGADVERSLFKAVEGRFRVRLACFISQCSTAVALTICFWKRRVHAHASNCEDCSCITYGIHSLA